MKMEDIQNEVNAVLHSPEVIRFAEDRGIDEKKVRSLSAEIRVIEKPNLTPGDLVTLAITILILDPLKQLIQDELAEIWKQMVLPRLRDRIQKNGSTLIVTEKETQQKGDNND